MGEPLGDFYRPAGHLNGETFHRRDYTLCEQHGTPLVLAFYPGDDTPGCTAQLCSCSDGLDHLQSAGAGVWGPSPQGVDSHKQFARLAP
ncbi:redoxin domain-containing protein [Streptomyces sp. NPDC089919]|uniref:redoxin domain-containing protein n=1 Tax=Streptomyces sp. NPDC089919 TaxID=3155188 RepID=UPI00341AE39C